MKAELPEWGQWVHVRRTAHITIDYPSGARKVRGLPCPDVYGRVVGVTYRREGELVIDGESRRLEVTRTVRVIRVATSWRTTVLALAEDLEPCEPRLLPFQPSYSWSELDKSILRDDVATRLRDARGRFL